MPEMAEATQERARAELAVCEDCGYELTFVRGQACPECGAPATVMLPELSRRYLAVRRVRLGVTLFLWGVPGMAFMFLLIVTVSNWSANTDVDVVNAAMSGAFMPVCVVLCGEWLLASPLGEAGDRVRWALRSVCTLAFAVACALMAQRVVARMPGGRLAVGGGPRPIPFTSFDVRDYLRWVLLALAPPMAALLFLVCAALARELGLRRAAQRWSAAGWVGAGLLCVLIAGDFAAQWAWNRVVTHVAPNGMVGQAPASAAYYPEKAVLVRLGVIAVGAAVVCVTWLMVLRTRMLLDRIPKPAHFNG